VSNRTGKNAMATRVGGLIVGTRKHFTNGSQQLSLAGGATSVTVDGAVSELQTFVTNRGAVVAAQATAKAKVDAETAQMAALLAFISAFEEFIRFTFGSSPEALADFGLAPPKARTPLTAEQKAVAAAKRKATREARGTAGAKQKQAVHGNVTAALVVTPAAPAVPEAVPAPAGGSTPQQK
jgi:hypothetical protein